MTKTAATLIVTDQELDALLHKHVNSVTDQSSAVAAHDAFIRDVAALAAEHQRWSSFLHNVVRSDSTGYADPYDSRPVTAAEVDAYLAEIKPSTKVAWVQRTLRDLASDAS